MSSLLEGLKKEIESSVSGIHTAMPAVIMDFDAEKCTATVQPLVSKLVSSGDVVDYPTLSNVPVHFPCLRGIQITFPVRMSDACLLIVCEEALDSWHSTPPKKSEFSLNNAVALVGYLDAWNKEDVAEAQSTGKLIIRGNVKIYGNLTADSYRDN